MRTFVLLTSLALTTLVAAFVAPDSAPSLFTRQLPSLIPADGVDAETTQCLATCAQQVAAAHQTEFQKCASQTTIEAQQACVCASDFFDENKKCIPKCFKDEVANEAADAMEASCSQIAAQKGGATATAGSGSSSTGGDTETGSNRDTSNSAAADPRAPGSVVLLFAVVVFAVL